MSHDDLPSVRNWIGLMLEDSFPRFGDQPPVDNETTSTIGRNRTEVASMNLKVLEFDLGPSRQRLEVVSHTWRIPATIKPGPKATLVSVCLPVSAFGTKTVPEYKDALLAAVRGVLNFAHPESLKYQPFLVQHLSLCIQDVSLVFQKLPLPYFDPDVLQELEAKQAGTNDVQSFRPVVQPRLNYDLEYDLDQGSQVLHFEVSAKPPNSFRHAVAVSLAPPSDGSDILLYRKSQVLAQVVNLFTYLPWPWCMFHLSSPCSPRTMTSHDHLIMSL
ncbi:hypothetical protein FRC14_003021 [Serendipita sp. 396]|nr:hypothetical protein FRC14_003021 [Serendipita sp. 396]KAG8788514.1 hypothetical protein FRC15_003841 [Serendipita sp. 397]KAG8803660.1 hypothetical protein FRC16_003919 [Serendipita sp. 398]KAG8875011.1 hypothetical protein FRC20_004728 [Serendipita sp. 405]